MINATEELLGIANKLEKHGGNGENPVFKTPLDKLEDAVNNVAKAWSGSWLGYHAVVYYDAMKTPPPGAHFSQEWGLPGGFGGQGTTGRWEEFAAEDVERVIYQRAGNPTMPV